MELLSCLPDFQSIYKNFSPQYMKIHTIFLVLLSILHVSAHATEYNVLGFGAKGDGTTKDTAPVQAAIDQCSAEGGGTLLGSPDISDYSKNTHKNMYKNEPHMDRCLIFADGVQSFAIIGKGKIDGNGYTSNFDSNTGRPMLMRFINCRDISIRDITLVNPAAWVSAWLYCDEIVVEGIRIHSRVNGNTEHLVRWGETWEKGDYLSLTWNMETNYRWIFTNALLP